MFHVHYPKRVVINVTDIIAQSHAVQYTSQAPHKQYNAMQTAP